MVREPLIVYSSGDERYRPFVENLSRCIRSMNYSSVMYNMGYMDVGISFERVFGWVPTRRREFTRAKPLCMDHARKYFNGPILWVDTDCSILGPVDFIFTEEEWDVGLYIKPNGKVKVDVVAINDTARAAKFISKYAEQPPTVRSDRTWMNKIVREDEGTRIKTLDRKYSYDVNNEDELDSMPSDTVIVHLKARKVNPKERLLDLL